MGLLNVSYCKPTNSIGFQWYLYGDRKKCWKNLGITSSFLGIEIGNWRTFINKLAFKSSVAIYSR